MLDEGYQHLSKNRVYCRFCKSVLHHTFVDLGMSPLCEAYLELDQLSKMEPFYPLHVYICDRCFLIQLQEYVSPDQIFSDYAYFSSYSDTWLQHAKHYADVMVEKFKLHQQSQVIEIASNDGYLLQYFCNKGVSVLGIEPAANVAEAAINQGIPTVVKFFGQQTAQELVTEGKQANLLVANNVLAHVPDLNDFVKGMKILLHLQGIITVEFPHLMRLMEGNQFDTIYHEHFSYFSLITAEQVFAAHGLILFDVEELLTHGGSLRVYVCHSETPQPVSQSVVELREREKAAGFTCLESYFSFNQKVKETKYKLLDFLIKAKRAGKKIVGYGAPGKGNTLLNYCGIRSDFIDFTVDRNPHKQGKFLPGTHIPVFHPDKIKKAKPDYLLILPWNLKDEVMHQTSYIRSWGGRFVVPIPELEIYSQAL